MTETIVVGIDGSPASTDALRWAVGRAARFGQTVRAVMAWHYPTMLLFPYPIGQPVPPVEAMANATAEALERIVGPVASDADVPIERAVAQGPAADVLVTAAGSASLLVVGSRGLSPGERVLRGSVSRRVVASSPCPVAVIPAGWVERDGPVVVGIDGSDNSMAALRWAAENTDGPIRAIHVYEPDFEPMDAFPDLTVDDAEALANSMLERLVEATVGPGSSVTTTAVLGDPREVLADAASDAAMLVVGARGVTGIKGFVLGSVATSLTTRTSSPVIVVPDRQDVTP